MGVYGEFKLDVNVWVILLPIDLMLKLTIAIRAVVLDGIWGFINGCLGASHERG